MVRAGGRTKPRISYNDDDESENDHGESSDDYRESPAPPPPKKRKPPVKPPVKKDAPRKNESSDDGMESDEDARPPVKKNDRAPPKKSIYKDESSGEEDGNESDIIIEEKLPKKVAPKKATPKKKAEKPPSKVVYKEVESSDDFQDDGEVDNEGDSDYEEPVKKSTAKAPAKKRGRKPDIVEVDSDSEDDRPPPKKRAPKKAAKKAPKKKTPAKKAPPKKAASAASRASGRGAAKPIKYTYDSNEEEEEEEDDSVEEISSDEAPPAKTARGKKKITKKPAGRGKPPPPKKKAAPPISEMFPSAIKKLRDNPRKGSSLAAIKGIMAEEWEVDVKALAPKIKKFIMSAVESGEIIQTKGKGASGRFTVPGLKVKRKKAKSHLTKKWDEDQEPEYKPTKTARSEDKEKFLGELLQRRKERMEAEARRLEDKEKMPKKIVVRKEFYEVESIKAMKTIGDKTWYQVIYENTKKGHWEPEENLEGCRELIDNFLMEEKVRLVQEEERRRREEEEGKYEVQKILEVKFKKGEKKEFLIRWKGHGEEMDSWEPQENLDCLDLIERFMKKWEARVEVEEKSLREAPKKVERLQFANSTRVGKRNNGFRKTYDDMDDDWD